MTPIYIAAPKRHAARARAAAAQLTRLSVVSTWHRTDPPSADPGDYDAACRILEANLADMRRAHIVLALTSETEGRETYVEIGRALALSLPVIMSAERGGLPLSFADAWASRFPTDTDAIEYILERWG